MSIFGLGEHGVLDLTEYLGLGDFSDIEKLYNSVSSALTHVGAIRSLDDVLSDIHDLANDINSNGKITTKHKKILSKLLNDGRDWSKAKENGKNALKGGKHRESLQLLEKLQYIGLFIVPIGTLESWDKSLSANKEEWILEALDNIDTYSKSFSGATEFVEQITKYFWNV